MKQEDISLLTTAEWKQCKDAVECLKRLETITATLSGEKYVSCLYVIILSKGLQNVYEEMQNKCSLCEYNIKVFISTVLLGIK